MQTNMKIKNAQRIFFLYVVTSWTIRIPSYIRKYFFNPNMVKKLGLVPNTWYPNESSLYIPEHNITQDKATPFRHMQKKLEKKSDQIFT